MAGVGTVSAMWLAEEVLWYEVAPLSACVAASKQTCVCGALWWERECLAAAWVAKEFVCGLLALSRVGELVALRTSK